MRVASLFSGCGGLDLGLEQAGHSIILQCESDPGCQQVLKYWFPGTLLAPDVCALEALPVGTELVAAGFPCIDVSRAGLRRGVEGECTGLVRHVFRLLQRAKQDGRAVPWVLLENVEALIDRVHGSPPAIQYITDALEQLGYSSWAHRVVCTAGFGVPNRRKRLFLVASMYGDARDVLFSQGMQACLGSCCACDPEGKPLPSSTPCYECYQPASMETKEGLDKCSLAFDLGNARCPPGVDVCPTFTTTNSRICLALEKQVGMMRTSDAERLQGFPEGWTEPCWPILGPGVHTHRKPTREADSDTRERARHALLGNAVSVPVAVWLGERLMDPYHRKYLGYSESLMPLELQSKADAISQSKWEDMTELASLSTGFLITGSRAMEQTGTGPEDLRHGTLVQGGGPIDPQNDVGGHLVAKAAGSGAGPSPGPEDAETGQDAGNSPVDAADIGRGGASGKRVASTNRITRSNNLGLWPSCAFFVRRQGRFAVHSVSDCPIKMPFVPLGAFISEVGRPPSPSSLHTYFMRLKEQGWDIQATISKMLRAGAGHALPEETRGIVQLIGEAGDVAKRGELVWAKDVTRSSTYWPAETLDPFNLPPGVFISPQQLNGLNQRERGMFLPIPGSDSADDASKSLMQHRKVLVIFFGDKSFNWQFKDTLLPFAPHQEAKTAELEALLSSRALNCTGHFKKAMEEVKMVYSMMHGSRDLDDADRDDREVGTKTLTHPALLSQAAQAAAAAAKMDRCGACEVCLSSQINRRCFIVRAHSAAAAGHTGAQMAVLGRGCIGARVSCWWPLDEAWYQGQVVDYDRFQVRHTVIYEDGDKEVIALWAPNQLVRIHNAPKDWPTEAEQIRRAQEARALANVQQIAAQAQHKAKMEEEALEAAKTPYERDRDARMANNNAALQRIMAGTDRLSPATPMPHEHKKAVADVSAGGRSPLSDSPSAAVDAPGATPTAATTATTDAGAAGAAADEDQPPLPCSPDALVAGAGTEGLKAAAGGAASTGPAVNKSGGTKRRGAGQAAGAEGGKGNRKKLKA